MPEIIIGIWMSISLCLAETPSNHPLAWVNDTVILQTDLENARKRLQHGPDSADLLEALIDEELLFQAARAEKLHLDPDLDKLYVKLLLKEKVYSRLPAEFSEGELKAHFDTAPTKYRSLSGELLTRAVARSLQMEKMDRARQDYLKELESKSQIHRYAEATPSKQDPDPVLGSIDGDDIRGSELDIGKALIPKTRKEALDERITQLLFAREARRQGIPSLPAARNALINRLMRRKLYEKEPIRITEAELKAHYRLNQAEFGIPEELKIHRILISTGEGRGCISAWFRARSIHRGLGKAPADFSNRALRDSDGPYRKKSGDLGYVTRDGRSGIDPLIIETAFNIKPESISKPFRTPEGYNIITTTHVHDAVIKPYAVVKGQIHRKLKNRIIMSRRSKYLASLRAKARIRIVR